jgi:hypothetical protein
MGVTTNVRLPLTNAVLHRLVRLPYTRMFERPKCNVTLSKRQVQIVHIITQCSQLYVPAVELLEVS